MTSRELDNPAKVGLLKAECGDRNEPAGLLESARKQALAPDSRFNLAYSDVCSFAGLLRSGFVLSSPISTAQR
jgi:hypothetical protein